MKFKRIISLLVVIAMLSCFVACRTKDESAMTVTSGDNTVKISTALYMCFMISADSQFQSDAVAKAQEDGTKYDDYKELKYEDKDYDTWVKDETKKSCENYAFYELEFDRLGLSLTSDDQDYIDYYCDAYWNGAEQQSVAAQDEFFKTNGVSYETYCNYMTSSYKQSMVFNYYTSETTAAQDATSTTAKTTAATTTQGQITTTVAPTTTKKVSQEIKNLKGSLRPSDKKIESAIGSNYVAVNAITVSLTDENGTALTSKVKKNYLSKLKGYAKQLEKGAKFDSIYTKYTTDFSVTSDGSTTGVANYRQELLSAKANKASGNGDEATENYDKYSKYKNGEVDVIENDDSYVLVQKVNILKESNSNSQTYIDAYTDYAIHILVDDSFEEDIVQKSLKDYTIDVNNSAINFYAPKKIDYGTTTTTASAVDASTQA